MKVAILDGYVDEPACLGVPPYISPYPRLLAGAAQDAGAEWIYFTIDQWRRGGAARTLQGADLLIVHGGTAVPGKYLRGMPASVKEIAAIAHSFQGEKILAGPVAQYGEKMLGGAEWHRLAGGFEHVAKQDADAFLYTLIRGENPEIRHRTLAEWNRWSVIGANVVRSHPDFPQPLLAEIGTYRGCVRQHTGGCSFCVEPLQGEPVFRDEDDIIAEVGALYATGVRNFRLGAQTCFFSYKASGIGETETPKPNFAAVERMLSGIRKAAPELSVLHIDNANPAVIAAHPEESREIAKSVVRYCTPGNVAALGLESTDPEVARKNNLNCTPEQALAAIRILNEAGAARGESGLPALLPGLNFVAGLDGESAKTSAMNLEFLRTVAAEGFLVRRINIRQVIPVRKEFRSKHSGDFKRFKMRARKEIDGPMLQRVVPAGTILRRVFLELNIGSATYGRQIGSYPLLVVLPYKAETSRFIDAMVTGHGERSITAVEFPLNVNTASLSALSAVPGVGRRRAMRLVRGRPFASKDEMEKCLDDGSDSGKIMAHFSL